MTLPIFLRTDNDNSSTASVAVSLVFARINGFTGGKKIQNYTARAQLWGYLYTRITSNDETKILLESNPVHGFSARCFVL